MLAWPSTARSTCKSVPFGRRWITKGAVLHLRQYPDKAGQGGAATSLPPSRYGELSERNLLRRNELMASWGRLGLSVAAFALIAGIVAALLLERTGSSSIVLASYQ